jgi:DNA polymerase-3 subunit delta
VNLGDLVAELEGGRLRPAYLLAGTEPLLRDDAKAALLRSVLSPSEEDFNFERLNGNQASAAELEEALETLPVMSSRRLVILNEPEGADARSQALLEALSARLPELEDPPTTVLVVTAAKADKRLRWVKAFKKPAVRVECEAPKDGRDIVSFIVAEAKRQQVEIAPPAAQLLAEQVGSQLLLLRREIEKIALLAGPGERIEREHVAESTQAVAEQPVWDLTDAIGEGRGRDALETLDRLLGQGAPAPVVLAALAGHFRKLLRVAEGGSVPGPSFVVQKLRRQARRYSVPKLEACLGFIHRTDTAIKGGGALPPELAIERLVIALAA